MLTEGAVDIAKYLLSSSVSTVNLTQYRSVCANCRGRPILLFWNYCESYVYIIVSVFFSTLYGNNMFTQVSKLWNLKKIDF